MGLRLFILAALLGSTLWADFKASGEWREIAQPHVRIAMPDGFLEVPPRTPPQDWPCVMAWVGEDAAGTGLTVSFYVTRESLAPGLDISGQFPPRAQPVSFSWYREEWQRRIIWCSRGVYENSSALSVTLAAFVPLADGTLRLEVSGPLQRELSAIILSRWLLGSLEGHSHWQSSRKAASPPDGLLGRRDLDPSHPDYGEALDVTQGTTVASALDDLLFASLMVALFPGLALIVILATRRRDEPARRARLVPPLSHTASLPAGTGGPVPPPRRP